ncbi:dTDP-4-dehydrorhamnose reductase [Thermodesulfobacteriota bacterium]
MKVVITGADGQVGWELQQTLPADVEITALGRSDLDITDGSAVTSVIAELHPDLVINAAAYTAVDKAEKEADKAYNVNVDGAANIARAVEEYSARLIHLSTDFVFDGNQAKPYLPEDTPNPAGVYGASKLQGERAVMASTPNRAVILRTAWVYSVHGSNFVKTMLRLMAERDELKIVADQVGSPTWAKELAKAIWLIVLKTDMHGIYHWTDDGAASWYDFAMAIQEEAHALDLLQKIIPVKPIKTEEYPTPAKRPPYSVLDKTSTCTALGYTPPHWRESLKKMLIEYKSLRTED